MTKKQIEARLMEILAIGGAALTLEDGEFLINAPRDNKTCFGMGKTLQEAVIAYDYRAARLANTVKPVPYNR